MRVSDKHSILIMILNINVFVQNIMDDGKIDSWLRPFDLDLDL